MSQSLLDITSHHAPSVPAAPTLTTSASSGISFAFPSGFKWGAACAAFQIEGGADAGGRGPSVWDVVSAREPGRFYGGHTPAVAADFYHRYAQDVAMMRELGLKSFRFSISWSRVMPLGRGSINREGLAFYHRLIDLLLENGIEPLVDLYHWDLPQALAEEGGFTTARIVDEFETYAALCFRSYSDRVKLWSTMNEPSALEHFNPFCPGNKDPRTRLAIDRNALMMHYAAVRAFRQQDRGKGQIGAVVAYVPVYPRSMDPLDRLAAERQQAFTTSRWLDPMLEGTYPQVLVDHPHIAANLPDDFLRQCREAHEPIDFIGLNYYTPSVIGHQPGQFLDSQAAEPFAAQSDYGFVNYPQGLFDSVVSVTQRYNRPAIYITENGLAHDSGLPGRELLEDDDRIQYIREHLRAVNRCIKAGADVRGYYYWSLLDTFESTSGYRYRFGLVQIDFDTLARTRRKSWHYYRQCIADNAVE